MSDIMDLLLLYLALSGAFALGMFLMAALVAAGKGRGQSDE